VNGSRKGLSLSVGNKLLTEVPLINILTRQCFKTRQNQVPEAIVSNISVNCLIEYFARCGFFVMVMRKLSRKR